MDVERTVRFLLEHQAAAEARQAAAQAEMAEIRAAVKENTAQIKILTAQQAKTNRRLDAFGKLGQTGMRILVKNNQKLDLLNRKVDRLIDSLRHSRNGGGRR